MPLCAWHRCIKTVYRMAPLNIYLGSTSLPDLQRSRILVCLSVASLEYVLRGVKRLQGTPAILRKLHRYWLPSADQFDIVMLWSASCLGFLRAAELR